MNIPNKNVVIQSLGEMEDELNNSKEDAESFLGDIDNLSPDDMQFDENDESMSVEDKEKVKDIKTPEDAKKVLDTVKTDVDNVINSLDGLAGQAGEEKEASKYKRFNQKTASDLTELSKKAQAAIDDCSNLLKHWAFLKKAKKVSKVTTTPTPANSNPLDEAFSTVEKSIGFVGKLAKALGYVKADKIVEATAVPPTGAEFTGDKWPEGKNPAEVENRHWDAGAEKFKRDKKFEDARPNPADEHRLDTSDYSRNDKPYVNASFKINDQNKFSSCWEIVDTKTGRKVTADFVNLPSELFPQDLQKSEQTFKQFASKNYGQRIIENVIEKGLEAVAKELNGKITPITKESLQVLAADKTSLKSYYTDAFGDSGYASELTQGAKKEMNVGYTPKDDCVKSKDTKTKDGTGKISTKTEDQNLINAKARRAVMLARKYASRNAIAFNYESIYKKAGQLMKLSDADFQAREAALEEIPIVNQAALIEAHIPDTEVGIVGNKAEGVRDQAAKVATEDIDSNVKSDATVHKTSSLVPQTFTDSVDMKVKFGFTDIKQRLEAKGIGADSGKLRLPKRI